MQSSDLVPGDTGGVQAAARREVRAVKAEVVILPLFDHEVGHGDGDVSGHLRHHCSRWGPRGWPRAIRAADHRHLRQRDELNGLGADRGHGLGDAGVGCGLAGPHAPLPAPIQRDRQIASGNEEGSGAGTRLRESLHAPVAINALAMSRAGA